MCVCVSVWLVWDVNTNSLSHLTVISGEGVR